MEVASVLVDDISLAADGSTAAVTATLYESSEPRWVSVHPEREGPAVGPLTLLQTGRSPEPLALPPLTTRQFGTRPLTVTRRRRVSAVSYLETWTRPHNCVYTLVLPPGCAATKLTMDCPGYSYQPPLDVAVTPDHRIFHYVVLMGERGTVHVNARIERDENQYQRVVGSAETVAATARYEDLRKHIREGALSSDFWFKLLTLGGKLLGGL
jgi:hypothetical protein